MNPNWYVGRSDTHQRRAVEEVREALRTDEEYRRWVWSERNRLQTIEQENRDRYWPVRLKYSHGG